MTEQLIAEVESAARAVYAVLGAGYEERVYEEAMAVEFRKRGLHYELERNTEIFYEGVKVGTHRLDFIVDGQLVVELKAATSISKSHLGQTEAYLRTLQLAEGVIVNFPYPERDEGPEVRSVVAPPAR